ncbi:MAG: HEAT repeat domain-containing protein [Lysobacter sp.]|nr:HEAT repeat domain-containing protein [Lysobacter sp.]
MDFESMVAEDWQRAVAQATGLFPVSRDMVLSALRSPTPHVRCAAVAVLLESDDRSAHDDVLVLLGDPDEDVRNEVLEYLAEFAQPEDARALLSVLRTGGHPFLTTSALCRSLGVAGPILDNEDTRDEVAAAINVWKEAISVRSAGASVVR